MEAKIQFDNYVNKPLTFYVNDNGQVTNLRLISEEHENRLDMIAHQVNEYMKNNNGRGLSDNEKDVLYEDAVSLLREYLEVFKEVKYSFYLTREQHNFITTLIKSNLEYNVDNVFVALEIADLIGSWSDKGKTFESDNEVVSFETDATSTTYLYHLIKGFTIKGINKTTYNYAQFLMRIGAISKVINYYDNLFKSTKEYLEAKWVPSFEDAADNVDVAVDANTSTGEVSIKEKTKKANTEA